MSIYIVWIYYEYMERNKNFFFCNPFFNKKILFSELKIYFTKNKHWKSMFYIALIKFLYQNIKYPRANRNERCKMCLCIYNFSVDTQRPSCLFWEKRIRKISELIFLFQRILNLSDLRWRDFFSFFSADGTK